MVQPHKATLVYMTLMHIRIWSIDFSIDCAYGSKYEAPRISGPINVGTIPLFNFLGSWGSIKPGKSGQFATRVLSFDSVKTYGCRIHINSLDNGLFTECTRALLV